MVMQFIEGFDWCGTINDLYKNKYITHIGDSSLSVGGGRFGGNAVNPAIFEYTRYLLINVPIIKNQLFFGTAIKSTNFNGPPAIDFSGHFVVYFSKSEMYIYKKSTVLESTGSFNANNWNYLAFDIFINDTSGYCKIYVNGDLKINYIGNTKETSLDDNLRYIKFGGAGTSLNTMYDDIYIADNTGSTNNAIILDARIQTLLPSSDTTQSDFIPLIGSDNYAMVDEALQDGDTSYVGSSTSGAKDLYNHTSLASNTTTVYSVSSFVIAKKTDVDLVNIKPIISSNGVESYSAESLLSDYALFSNVIDLNPDTTSSWTPSEVNNSLVGFSIESV